MNERMMLIAALGLGAGVLVWLVFKNGAQNVGQGIGSAVVELPTGVVYGMSDAMGIPRTNQTQCERDLAAGRTWDASFSCPAGTFIKSFF